MNQALPGNSCAEFLYIEIDFTGTWQWEGTGLHSILKTWGQKPQRAFGFKPTENWHFQCPLPSCCLHFQSVKDLSSLSCWTAQTLMTFLSEGADPSLPESRTPVMFLMKELIPAFQRAGAQGPSPGGPWHLGLCSGPGRPQWRGGRTGCSSIPPLLWWGRRAWHRAQGAGRRNGLQEQDLPQAAHFQTGSGHGLQQAQGRRGPRAAQQSPHTALQPL